MGALNKLDQRLEALVNGVFAKAFKSAAQPFEFASVLQRECDINARIWSRDRIVAPNNFLVELSSDDFERHSTYLDVLGEELADKVREYATAQRYSFIGPLKIQLRSTRNLNTGRYRVHSRIETQPGIGQARGVPKGYRGLHPRHFRGDSRRGQLPHPMLQQAPRWQKQLLSRNHLETLGLSISSTGMLTRADGKDAAQGLLRPSPYGVVLVGGLWAAQLIALRAGTAGARIAVETGRSHAWNPVARAADGGRLRLEVHPIGRLTPQTASAAGPLLIVRDCGPHPATAAVPPRPWQTVLTLLPYFGAGAEHQLSEADLVGVQRVAPQEAGRIAEVLRLNPREAAALPGLGDDATLWADRQSRHFLSAAPTADEAQVLGPARRVD
ncbi:DUF3662 domain-containing protein [Peterkaempfera sp. SMS 1(5)a]|uniref:DUF3662 domain-containing protein n=1 Tax=Peterkaempfera podocarpi TaxID=3232308 RepID=UPI00366D0C61